MDARHRQIESLPPSPAPGMCWAGVSMLQGGKGYADAPLGQLHYRDVGPRDAPIPFLLIHQSPMSMVEFGAIQNSLAALGYRSVATDTPGYGLSDQPRILPTIGGLADNLVAVLDHLKIAKVVVGGHHTGACISTALAARHPDRVAGVILHGCPVYTPEEAEHFRRHPEWDLSPKKDGAHLSYLFRNWDTGAPSTPEEMFARTWMSITMFLQGVDLGHWAVNRYDMAADLMAMTAPGLIITDMEDMIHYMDERALKMRPDFSYRVLAEKGTTGIMTDPDAWAKLAAEFMDNLPR